jgi:hypothetical protein
LSRNQTQLILSITRVRNIETGMGEGGRERKRGEESNTEYGTKCAQSHKYLKFGREERFGDNG